MKTIKQLMKTIKQLMCKWFGHKERSVPLYGIERSMIICSRCGHVIADFRDDQDW